MENVEEVRHSKLNMASYGSGSAAREFVNMAFTATVFFYYEAALGLAGWIVTIAIIIFAIYNMFNDPIIGYLTNRPFKFTRRWGRRFPWLLIGGIPLAVSYLLVFMPPITDPVNGTWFIFGWLILTTCLFDTFHSIFFVSFIALFTEKYRSDRARRIASGIYIPIGVIGVALGALLPPLFFIYPGDATRPEVLASFVIQGAAVMLVCLIGILLAIPGFREDKEIVENYIETYEKNPQRDSFFSSLKLALKQNSFIIYMVIYSLYQACIVTMQNSVNYTVNYVILPVPGLSKNLMATLIFASFLVGVIVATPIWVKISHKWNNNKKIMIVSGIFLGVLAIPLAIFRNYWLIVGIMFFWGFFGLSGFWFMIFPVMSDVIDDSVVITGKREEGVYSGFSQFFARLGIVAQAITFGVIHFLTGFVEGGDPSIQPPEAIVGIQIHQGLIPAIFIFIGVIVFWKWYKLTPDKIAQNKIRIEEMGIK